MSHVVVTTAVELTKTQVAEVEKLVKSKLGTSKFELEEKVDPTIIGGVQLVINSRQYDASVRGKLAALQKSAE